MVEQRKKLRLGELLIQQGLLTPDQLGIALAEQRQDNIPIGRMLVRLGFITEAAIRDIMARTVGQEAIDLAHVVADHEALKLVPQDFARRHRMLPIAYDVEQRVLSLATPEIFNVVAFDQLRAMLGPSVDIKTHLAGEAQLEDYIDQFYGQPRPPSLMPGWRPPGARLRSGRGRLLPGATCRRGMLLPPEARARHDSGTRAMPRRPPLMH